MKEYSPINFRGFLVVALFVIAEALSLYVYAYNVVAGIVLGVCVIAGACVAAIVATVKFVRKSARLRFVVTFWFSAALCVVALTVGACYANFRTNIRKFEGYAEVYGRLCTFNAQGDYTFGLDKLEINGEKTDGILRLNVTFDDNTDFSALAYGDYLHFNAYVSVGDFVRYDGLDASSVRTGVVYYARVKADNVAVTFGKTMPIKQFLYNLHDLLVTNMGDRYGNIAFSMLTGDKNWLEYDISEAFSASGLGHLMAVSGLHIGFLVALLNFILKKVDKRIRLPIITAAMIAYAVIADFSPSVVRALIMAVVSMLSFVVGGRRDILSSMCCAMSLILAVSPYYLFEVGFLLSFGAIFGITLFANTFKNALTKIKVNEKIANAVSSSVSVQAGLLPAQLRFFGNFQVFSIIVNMVLLPYISLVYTVILVILPFAAIPHCGIILNFGMYLLMPIDGIAQGLSAVPYAVIGISCTDAVMLCYPAMFFASEFLMLPKGKKLPVVLASVAACLSFCFISLPPERNYIYVLDENMPETVVNYNGKTYIIGYMSELYEMRVALDKQRVRKIDGIYLLGESSLTYDYVVSLSQFYFVDKVYSYDLFGFGTEFLVNGIDFYLMDDDGDVKTASVAGEFVGYELGDMLFADKKTDERNYVGYSVVRTTTVNEPKADVTYLCNYVDEEKQRDNVYTTQNGAYVYAL